MAKKKKKKAKKKKGLGFKGFFLALCAAVMAIMFLPTTFLLAFGMLPTLVALGIDRDPGKNKSVTIGAMNFAGCFPYLVGIWSQGNPMDAAMSYLANPVTVVIMYGAAAIGYLINWFVTLGVASILAKRSEMRIKRIEEEKKALEERWGTKVNGNYILDDFGFPIQSENPHAEETSKVS